MKKSLPKDQDFDLWWLLAQTRHAMFRARMKELHRYNISARQATVLLVIRALGDKATPAEISRRIFRESQSVSEFLSRMEKDGLVSRIRDLDRKNMVRVVLTERGLEAHYQTLKRESIHRIVSCLSKEEQQQLRISLEKLWHKALQELGVGQRPPFPSPE